MGIHPNCHPNANGAASVTFAALAGAKLLDDHDGYDCAKTLPEDKAAALVFYCSGKL